MAAMERCCDVVHLEDSIWMGCKDLKKQSNVKYYLLSTLLAMVDALQSLWAALLPFVLLWWNVMLYATCSKYYSWNRAGLRLQIAGRNFHGGTILYRCSHPEETDGEESDKGLVSSHQRESCADASHTDSIELAFSSLSQGSTCGEVTCYDEKVSGCPIPHQESQLLHLHHDLDASIDALPHQNALCLPDSCGGMTSAFLDVLHPRRATSPTSSAQALVASSQMHISKPFSLCFLDRKQLRSSCFWDSCDRVASIFLSPNQVPPSAMLDVSSCFQILLDVNFLTEDRLLELRGLLLIDGVSVGMPVLRGILCSQTRNHKVPLLQFLIRGLSISHAASASNVMVSREARITEEPSVGDLSGCMENCTVALVDDEDGFQDLDDNFSVQSLENDGHCFYNCYGGYTDSSVDDVDYADDVEGSFSHPATSTGDVLYDHCRWDLGYHDQHSVKDVEDICSMDFDAVDANMEDRDAVYDGIYLVFEDGVYENSLSATPIHVAEVDTWWEEGAVFIDNQAIAEDDIELEWEIV